jgi:hypothetical protein
LVREQNELPVVDARITPGVLQQHQRQQRLDVIA